MTRRTRRLWTYTRAALSRVAADAWRVLSEEPGTAVGDRAERAASAILIEDAGELRGGMAKVAQLMGYLEGPGAAVDHDARHTLGASWDALSGIGHAQILAVVDAELGPGRFAHFSSTPLAAASLGQVHVAEAAGAAPDQTPRRKWAVKVQYPGVAAALTDDLASGVLLRRLAGSDVGGALPAASVAALREAILAELDYRREADLTESFGRAFAGDATIVVPAVNRDLSTGKILTTELLVGERLSLLREAPEDVRARVALTLFRFAYGAPLRHGLCNADPNPGNYLVLDRDTGRVGFLDYGCAVELDPALVVEEKKLWRAALEGEGEPFRMAVFGEGLLGQKKVLSSTTYRDWEKYVVGPFRRDSFTWTHTYAAKLAQLTSTLVRAGGLELPPHALLLWRQRIGVAAVLGSLTPTANFRAALTALLA